MNRRDHWETVYQQKSPLEVSWYQLEPKTSVDLIRATNEPVSAALIDIGGGASTLVDRLLALGYSNLSVLDIAANALQQAQQRLGAEANHVSWLNSDITEFIPPKKYRIWHDRAVFHFLTEASDRSAYRHALDDALEPGGQLIIAAFALDGPNQCSGLPIQRYDAGSLLAELGGQFKLVQARSETHRTPQGWEQQFGYYRLIKREAS